MAKDLNIKIKSDSKEAESGIKKITSQLNSLSKDIKKSDVSKLAKSFTAVTAATAGAVAVIKKANDAVKETTELYKKQASAEKQLEVAAKNNPYLNSQSVQQLKDYASYLQSISTTGDEELIPMMAQLAAAGRTQSQIQDIMSAALDVSASGMMSLDSAVTSLNKTYSGSVGLLGNQISDLKTLTAEQLKNGDAVKIVAEKFKGMSEEVTKATGSSEQLKNAIGDMKEEIGAGFEKGLSPMRKFFTELISGWTNAKKARREYEEAVEANESGKSTSETLQTEIDGKTKELEKITAAYNRATELLKMSDKDLKKSDEYSNFTTWSDSSNPLADFKSQQEAVIANYEAQKKEIDDLNAKLQESVQMEQAQKEAAEQAAQAATTQAEADEKTQKAIDLMQKNQAALDKEIEQIKLRAKFNGEEADSQEILNAMINSYISLVTTDNSLVTENNTYAKKRLELIQEYAASLQDVDDGLTAVTESEEDVGEVAQEQLSGLEGFIDKLKDFLNNLNENEDFTKFTDKLSDISKVVNEVDNITSQATELATDSIEAQTESELAALDEQYEDGLITYEEYQDKKKEINKQAAQEEYKLKMWEWHASLLTATANVAQGVSKAIADNGYPLGIVMGSLAALSGALEIATITANKPTAPSFATGGIVPGTSYTGDNVKANVNSGEMILNAAQQAQLWSMANGNSGGTQINMPVTIQNNNGSSVNTKMDKNGLVVIIDDIVNSSMQAGKYTKSMNIAQSESNGSSYY